MRRIGGASGWVAVALTVAAWLLVESRKEVWFWDHFDAVKPGLLYRSGQLGGDQLAEAIRHLDVKTVVNLQHPGPEAKREQELVESFSINYVNLPMPGDGLGREEQFRQVLALLDDPANAPILVHCARGVCRTGATVGLYRLERDGWVIEDVAFEMERHGYRAGWLPGFVYEMVEDQPYRRLYGPRVSLTGDAAAIPTSAPASGPETPLVTAPLVDGDDEPARANAPETDNEVIAPTEDSTEEVPAHGD